MSNKDALNPEQGTPDGLHRRSIVAGAAWSMPAIAVAAAAPSLAASTATLEFDQPSYSIAGCGVLEDVVVTATNGDGSPAAAGTPITITLPEGFTFTDGSTSPLVLSTDASGKVALPPIKAPINATSATLTANSEQVTQEVSSPLEVTAVQANKLFAGANFSGTDFKEVGYAGLPAGFAFEQIYASEGAVYATLADGRVFTQRENNVTGSIPGNFTWYDTGFTGNVQDWTISSSIRGGLSLVLRNGELTTFTTNNNGTAPIVKTPLSNPPGGAPVKISTSNGLATYYAESPDGRLWLTPATGAQRGTWTEITGFPTPLVDWTTNSGNGAEQVHVIGSDGKLYGQPTGTGIRPSVLVDRRHANATYTEPLIKFAAPHRGNDGNFGTTYISMIDANGGLYKSWTGTQNVNLAGALDGQLQDLDVLLTTDAIGDSTTSLGQVIANGKLYLTNYVYNMPLRDITPPDSLLNGATIIDAHSTGFEAGFAIDSNGKVWQHDRVWNSNIAVQWSAATGLDETTDARGILQDGKWTYSLGSPTECP